VAIVALNLISPLRQPQIWRPLFESRAPVIKVPHVMHAAIVGVQAESIMSKRGTTPGETRPKIYLVANMLPDQPNIFRSPYRAPHCSEWAMLACRSTASLTRRQSVNFLQLPWGSNRGFRFAEQNKPNPRPASQNGRHPSGALPRLFLFSS
jgi:hypothetical protein